MNYKNYLVVFFICLSTLSFSQTNHLISIKEFKTIQNSETPYTLIDLRKPKDYNKGHISDAINLWRTQIVDSSLVFGGMRISKDTLQALFSKIGVNTNDKIIIYDAKGDVDAARLWWILYGYGHKNTALLNGGLTEWKLQKNEVTLDFIAKNPTDYNFPNAIDNSLIVSLKEIQSAVKDSNVYILDTRSFDEFVGNQQKKGAYRKGRIPNSVLIDWAAAINYNGNRKFKTFNELKSIYSLGGLTKDQPIITYCQSGVRSAHTTFVLTELLGYTNVKNYDGSWIEWSYHTDLPIQTGEVVKLENENTDGCSKDDNSDCQTKFFIIIGSIIALLLIVNLYFRRKNKV